MASSLRQALFTIVPIDDGTRIAVLTERASNDPGFGRFTSLDFPADVAPITFDAVLSETHEFRATKTSHPVEDGSRVTDDLVPQDDVLRLTCAVGAVDIYSNDSRFGGEQLEAYRRWLRARSIFSQASSHLSTLAVLAGMIPGVESVSTPPGMLLNDAGASVIDAMLMPKTPEFGNARQKSMPERQQEIYDRLLGLRNEKRRCKVYTRLRLFEPMVLTELSEARTPDQGDTLVFNLTLERVRIVESRVVAIRAVGKKPRGVKNTEKPKDEGKKDSYVVDENNWRVSPMLAALYRANPDKYPGFKIVNGTTP